VKSGGLGIVLALALAFAVLAIGSFVLAPLGIVLIWAGQRQWQHGPCGP
jgi:hypothetical protein